MIKLHKISRSFRKIKALSDVSFHIPEGSISGIIGPNGAGKSTLFKVISGHIKQDHGDIYIEGRKNPPFKERMKLISYMPDDLSLYPDLSVSEFVDFVSISSKKIPDNLVETLSLDRVWKRRIGNLSKGFSQRLKLFSALLPDKIIVFLDEPLDGFDPIQLIEVTKLIKDENLAGKTFVLSIHDLYQAEKVCNFFVLLKDGRVVESGDMESLKEKYNADNLEEIFIRSMK